MTRYLVIGGAGFLGNYVSRQLSEQKDAVVGIIDKYDSYGAMSKDEYNALIAKRFDHLYAVKYPGDITDRGLVFKFIELFKPDVIIHLAAYPRAALVEKHPEIGVNTLAIGLKNVLDAAAANNVKHITYISSSMVYGDFPGRPPIESDPCHPKTTYGIYKLAGEQLCQLWANKTGSTANIVRPSAAYGPLDMPGRVVERFFYNAMHDIPLKVQGYDEILDFTYLNDIGNGIIAASQYHHNDIFNITYGQGWTLGEAAKIIVGLVGKGELNLEPRDPSYPVRGALDINNAVAKLGYHPQYDLERGLTEYYEWLSK